MGTHFLFASKEFSPTAGELDDEHDDYINPGAYALELGDFLEKELGLRGYPAKFRCQEDWGHWMELDHQGNLRLPFAVPTRARTLTGRQNTVSFCHRKSPTFASSSRRSTLAVIWTGLPKRLRTFWKAIRPFTTSEWKACLRPSTCWAPLGPVNGIGTFRRPKPRALPA